MGMVIGLASRGFFVLVLIISLRIIQFSWTQTFLITAIALLLPMVNPSRVLARASIGLVLIWCVAIALGAAPTYPELTQGVQSLSRMGVPQFVQDGIPKVQNGIADIVTNGLQRPGRDNSRPPAEETQGLARDYGEQLQAIDLLARSGAILEDDAARLKKEISDKALRRQESQAANHH